MFILKYTKCKSGFIIYPYLMYKVKTFLRKVTCKTDFFYAMHFLTLQHMFPMLNIIKALINKICFDMRSF